MATRSMPFWPRPATTTGSSWPGSGLCAPFSGRLSWSGITRAAPPPHPPERPNSLFHRRLGSVKLGDNAEIHPLDCADIHATHRGCLRDGRPDQHGGHECSCRKSESSAEVCEVAHGLLLSRRSRFGLNDPKYRIMF